MKKKLKIILGVLFTISAIFIGTGAILITNDFYVVNDSQKVVTVICETKDGEIIEETLDSNEDLSIYSKKVFQLNNDTDKFKKFIVKITIINDSDTVKYVNPEWDINTEQRKNTFTLEYKLTE